MSQSDDEFVLETAHSIRSLVDQMNTRHGFELVKVFEHDDNNRAYALLRRVTNRPVHATRVEYRLVRKRDYGIRSMVRVVT